MPAQGWGSGLRKQLIARYPFSLSKSGFDILHTKKWIADKLFLTVCWAFPAVKLKKKKRKKVNFITSTSCCKGSILQGYWGKGKVCLFVLSARMTHERWHPFFIKQCIQRALQIDFHCLFNQHIAHISDFDSSWRKERGIQRPRTFHA